MSGDLPAGWEASTLGDCIELHYGKSLPAKIRDNTGYPVVGSGGPSGLHSVPLVRKPCIVVGRKGTTGAIIPMDGPCWPIDTTYYLDDSGPFDMQFLTELLRASRLDEMNRSTAIPGLNRNDAYAVQVPVAPLNEQRRIVAKLDALQSHSRKARAALDAIPTLLDRFRQSVLAAAFRGDLTADWRAAHPDVEPASALLARIRVERKTRWIADYIDTMTGRARKRAEKKGKPWTEADEAKARKGYAKKAEERYEEPAPVDAEKEGLPELPEGWCWTSLDFINDPARPLCYGVVQPGTEVPDGPSLVRVCDLSDGTIHESGLRTISGEVDGQYDRSRLRGGEVLVSIVGTIGRVAEVPSAGSGWNIARALARITPVLEWMPQGWVGQWLSSPNAQHLLGLGAREVARKTLNLSDLRNLPIPLAPRAEMEFAKSAAAARVAGINTIEAAVPGMASDLDRLNQSLLAKAFRGELVPQDPTDEPAADLLARIQAER